MQWSDSSPMRNIGFSKQTFPWQETLFAAPPQCRWWSTRWPSSTSSATPFSKHHHLCHDYEKHHRFDLCWGNGKINSMILIMNSTTTKYHDQQPPSLPWLWSKTSVWSSPKQSTGTLATTSRVSDNCLQDSLLGAARTLWGVIWWIHHDHWSSLCC